MTTRSTKNEHQASVSLNVLLTGGRAPVTLDLARMLQQAGHRVYVAESAVRHLCRLSSAVERCFTVPSPRHETENYLLEMERLVQAWQIDLLIPMCEEVFYIAQGAERLGDHCRVLVSSIEQLHELHHKYDFIQLAESLGLSVPDTRLINSQQEWLGAQPVLEMEGEWVWKPVYSRFAAKVRMPISSTADFDGGPSDKKKYTGNMKQYRLQNGPPGDVEISVASPWVAQAYVAGQMLCTYSVAYEGKIVAHTTYDSRYRTGSVGASVFFEHVEHEGVYEWVRKFVHATGFSGQIGFDFIETEDGQLYAIECNPRATSGIHLFHPGDGLVRALIAPDEYELGKETKVVTPEQGSKAMLTLPMLVSGLQQLWRKGSLGAWITAWRGTRDVVYQRHDPKPWFEQFAVVLTAWRLARKHKLSLTEALTHDIEWNGEQR
ncbi:hypothetical protein B2I21_10275 [Chryseobacterium mucoviscidosis]|nr:hypothetical protein B2I21_10275 [Chryseobacterium mucoviscidosis]